MILHLSSKVVLAGRWRLMTSCHCWSIASFWWTWEGVGIFDVLHLFLPLFFWCFPCYSFGWTLSFLSLEHLDSWMKTRSPFRPLRDFGLTKNVVARPIRHDCIPTWNLLQPLGRGNMFAILMTGPTSLASVIFTGCFWGGENRSEDQWGCKLSAVYCRCLGGRYQETQTRRFFEFFVDFFKGPAR